MTRKRILNPSGAPAALGALALSGEILAEAKAVKEPGQCGRLGTLTAQLHGVAPERIDGDAARIAFWANLYNSLVLHCLCLRPLKGSLLRHRRMFDRVAYTVGGSEYPLNLIENGVLRGNRRMPVRLRRPLGRSDPRLRVTVSRLDPRIHFALNCGARSCPPIRAYDPEALDEQLEMSTRTYLEVETVVDAERCRIMLPRLMRLYRTDFGDRAEQLAFAARYVPAVRECLERESRQPRVGYSRFDWTVTPTRSA
jgi:Protein of unknown function, DUF547